MVEFILQNFSSAAENGRKFSVIDACCGIGPFVIPLAKKKKNLEKYKNFDKILANDLNPDSVFYLKENIKLNKIDCQSVNIQVSEPVDGVEFIKNSLLGHDFSDQIVVILMNLPRFSVSLLMKNMVGCLVDISEERQAEFRKKFPYKITILAHHMSGRDQNDEKSVQAELPENFVLKEIWDVRKLIGEHYLRIMVEVPVEELFRRSAEPSAKKSKID